MFQTGCLPRPSFSFVFQSITAYSVSSSNCFPRVGNFASARGSIAQIVGPCWTLIGIKRNWSAAKTGNMPKITLETRTDNMTLEIIFFVQQTRLLHQVCRD